MGDLSHKLETLLISLDDGRTAPSQEIGDVLQRSVDELHRMRDTIIAGKKVTAAVELEKHIHQINAREVVVADEAEAAAQERVETPAEEVGVPEAGDTVSVEFTIEPEEVVSMVIVDTPLNEEIA